MATYPDLDGALDLVNLQILQDLDIDPTDSENVEWVNRGLNALRRTVARFWQYAQAQDLDFIHARQTLALAAAAGTGLTDARLAVPATFRRFGDQGFMSIAGQRQRVRWRDPQWLNRKREFDPSQGAFPIYVTVQEFASDAAFFYFWPFNTSACTLNLGFEQRTPEITLANPGGLEFIPKDLWESVLLVGIEEIMAMKGGDGRLGQLSQRFERALEEMYTARRHGQDEVQSAGGRGLGRLGMH